MPSPLTPAEVREIALRVAHKMVEELKWDRQQEAAATACPQCAALTARVAELEAALAAAREERV